MFYPGGIFLMVALLLIYASLKRNIVLCVIISSERQLLKYSEKLPMNENCILNLTYQSQYTYIFAWES